MKKLFISGLILLVIILSVIYFRSPVSEESIFREIQKANYCNAVEDCVDVGGKCPFGCTILVNQREAKRIRDLINSFDSKCIYGCVGCPGIKCVNNTCKTICK